MEQHVENLKSGDYIVVTSFREAPASQKVFAEVVEGMGLRIKKSTMTGIPYQVVSISLPFIACRPLNEPKLLVSLDVTEMRFDIPNQDYVGTYLIQYHQKWQAFFRECEQRDFVYESNGSLFGPKPKPKRAEPPNYRSAFVTDGNATLQIGAHGPKTPIKSVSIVEQNTTCPLCRKGQFIAAGDKQVCSECGATALPKKEPRTKKSD